MMTFEEFCMEVNSNDKLIAEKTKRISAVKKGLYNFGGLGYMNSLSGNALKVGSIKVSTINLARIAYESNKNETKYINILKDRLQYNLEALDVVRDILKKNVERGLLPNFNDGMLDFEHLYNTVGINGIYETMKTFGYTEVDEFGNTKYRPEAFKFGELILKTIRDFNKEFAKDKGYQINVEQVPGESAADKFLKADMMLYPTQAVKDLPLYANQWIGLGIKATLKDRIDICSAFDGYCNGGSIMHINVDAPFNTPEQAWDMLNYIADKGVTYFAFNGKYSTDNNGHLFYGDICPECHEHKTGEYTRVVGFITKTASWSEARRDEYKKREWMPLNDKGKDA